jgi:hypothetical protein
MSEYLVKGLVELKPGAVVCIDDGAGMFIYVWEGTVWLTEAGDGRDQVIESGQWARLSRPGRAVLSALGESAIALTSPRASGFARAIDFVPAPGRPAISLAA